MCVPDNWFHDNIKLVYRVIHRFRRRWEIPRHYLADDFLGSAYLAFCKLRETFKDDAGMVFSSYYYAYAGRRLLDDFMAHENEYWYRLVRRYYVQLGGRKVGVDRSFDIHEIQMEMIRGKTSYQPRGQRFYRAPIDFVIDDKIDYIYQLYGDDIAMLRRHLFSSLTVKQMEVVDLYFYRGIDSYRIAERLGVSHQRISQVLVVSLNKMRDKINKLMDLASIFGIHSEPLPDVRLYFNGGISATV